MIIPSGPLGSKQLENDPRIDLFINNARINNACFVIGHTFNLTETYLFPKAISNNITIYPDSEELIRFAHQLGSSLSLALVQ